MDEREWGINDWSKPNFIDTFECSVCKRVHENLERVKHGQVPLTYMADEQHYGCPEPLKFKDYPQGNMRRVKDQFWSQEWVNSYYVAKAIRQFVEDGRTFNKKDVNTRAHNLRFKGS